MRLSLRSCRFLDSASTVLQTKAFNLNIEFAVKFVKFQHPSSITWKPLVMPVQPVQPQTRRCQSFPHYVPVFLGGVETVHWVIA